jgi:hypothetical protein
METTEKIVEAYVRYIKKWATIPNIRCKGQYEIDLLAIDPNSTKRYHIESSVSISGGSSKLNNKPYSEAALKERTKQPAQRRTLGYFLQRKFSAPEIVEELKHYGFVADWYRRVIVTWGWTEDAHAEAAANNVELWDFRKIVLEIARASSSRDLYFTDDTIRTLQLYAKAMLEQKKRE